MIYSLLWNIKEERFGFHWLPFCGDTVQVNGNCSLYHASATEGNVYRCVMTSMWVNHRFLIFGMNWNDDHVFFSAHSYRLTSSLEQKMFWRMSPIKPVPIGNLEIQPEMSASVSHINAALEERNAYRYEDKCLFLGWTIPWGEKA